MTRAGWLINPRKVTDMAADLTFGERLLKSLLQAGLLLLAGAVLGGACNSLRHDGLPWVADSSPGAQGAIPSIGIMEAWKAYQKDLVQFVDARSPGEYAAGHLPGALSLPEEGADTRPDRVQLPANREIVIYCSDPACPKSALLASLLDRRGVKGLRVMPEGWAGWYDAGLPYEGGE
jgi:rhodanese-related sulfurtransferase